MKAVILSGGKSSRLNNKAFVKLNDKTIIELVIERLDPIFDEVIIVSNENSHYKKIKKDIIKDKGPLGGIYTGLKEADDSIFVLACDMPFLSVDLVRYMIKESSGYDAVVPRYEDYLEPLHAVYSKSLIPLIEEQIKNNELKLKDFIDKIGKVKFIDSDIVSKFDPEKRCFFNVNTKEDLEKARELIGTQS